MNWLFAWLFRMLSCIPFTVTDEGKAAMLRESPKPPVLSRSQQRCRKFLDEDSGVSFRTWLGWRRA